MLCILFQRFFKYLCIASKVRSVVDISKEALDHGKVSVLPYKLFHDPTLYQLHVRVYNNRVNMSFMVEFNLSYI